MSRANTVRKVKFKLLQLHSFAKLGTDGTFTNFHSSKIGKRPICSGLLRLARHAVRICLVPKPVKYNLTSCFRSPVTRARFQTG